MGVLIRRSVHKSIAKLTTFSFDTLMSHNALLPTPMLSIIYSFMNCNTLVLPILIQDAFILMSFVTDSRNPFSNYDFHGILEQCRGERIVWLIEFLAISLSS